MADFKRRCKGRVMVNINNHPDIRLEFDGFQFNCLDSRYSNTSRWEGKADVTGELVIMSWEPGRLGKSSNKVAGPTPSVTHSMGSLIFRLSCQGGSTHGANRLHNH